jgi:hypothetical protein
LRHAISDNEYAIATRIKDFGNNIHEKGGIENSLDAKYAIQACLHLVLKQARLDHGGETSQFTEFAEDYSTR